MLDLADDVKRIAGFPVVCPNRVTNLTAIAAQGLPDSPASMFFFRNQPVPGGCNAAGWCAGDPATVSECLKADGITLNPLRVDFAGSQIEPTSFASAAISVSVIIQIVVFISIGAYADYGMGRYRMLMAVTALGALLCLLMLAVTADTWWLGGILGVLINVVYGASFIAYNAWLPHLAAKHPDVLGKYDAASAAGRAAIQTLMDFISGRGFMWGYFGSVACMLICVVFTLLLPATIAYPINIAIAGVWWAGFAVWTFRVLRPRPGPPLPANTNPLFFSWSRTCSALSNAAKLPNLWRMLGLWFLYSDGFSVIASVGALYANSEVRFTFSKSLALSILIVLSPLCAAIGNFVWQWVADSWKLPARTMIMMNLFFMAVLPIWGLLGFATTAIGLREGWELFLGIIIYGFNLGSVQSFSRSLFASMTPRHRMSETFAVYEVTDKGSAWLGPFVVSVLQQGTGDIRWSFLYILLMLVVPGIGLLAVDPAAGHQQAIAVEIADGFILPDKDIRVAEGLEMTETPATVTTPDSA